MNLIGRFFHYGTVCLKNAKCWEYYSNNPNVVNLVSHAIKRPLSENIRDWTVKVLRFFVLCELGVVNILFNDHEIS